MRMYLLSILILFLPHVAVAQTAKHIKIIQNEETSATFDYRKNLDNQCRALCGDGYFYDRPGNKNNGREKVCTKYLVDCGYSCTTGWNFRYLVGGTDFTCQEAVQTPNR